MGEFETTLKSKGPSRKTGIGTDNRKCNILFLRFIAGFDGTDLNNCRVFFFFFFIFLFFFFYKILMILSLKDRYGLV